MYVKLLDKTDRLRVTAQCVSYAESDVDGLLLIELPDVTSAIEAIWSHIVKGRTERNLTDTNAYFHVGGVTRRIRVVPSTKYHRDKKVTDRLILLHDGLTRFRYDYLLCGSVDEPSPWFLPALQLRLPIPVLPHWSETLWTAARANHLVTPADTTYGSATVWKLNASEIWIESWSKMIQELVKAKKLTAKEVLKDG